MFPPYLAGWCGKGGRLIKSFALTISHWMIRPCFRFLNAWYLTFFFYDTWLETSLSAMLFSGNSILNEWASAVLLALWFSVGTACVTYKMIYKYIFSSFNWWFQRKIFDVHIQQAEKDSKLGTLAYEQNGLKLTTNKFCLNENEVMKIF